MIESDKINALVKTIESTIENYLEVIKKSGKAVSEPRSNDISSIRTILSSFYSNSNTVLDKCTHAMKGYVASIKTGWWFLKSRLKLSLTAAIVPFENPIIAIQFTENLRLQQKLDEAFVQIHKLIELNNDLRHRLDTRPAETRPIPVPAPAPVAVSAVTSAACSINNNGEQENDLEVGGVPDSHRSLPNFKNIVRTPESFGSVNGRMFVRPK